MSPGAASRGSSGSTTLRPPGTSSAAATSAAASSSPAHARRHSSSSHSPADVLQHPHGAADAELVGDVGRQRGVRRHRARPARSRRATTCRTRCTPPDGRDAAGRRRRRSPCRGWPRRRRRARRPRGSTPRDGPEHRARFVQLGQQVAAQPEGGDDLVAPAPRRHVEQLRRAGVGDVVGRRPAQGGVDEVGHHQQPSPRRGTRRVSRAATSW